MSHEAGVALASCVCGERGGCALEEMRSKLHTVQMLDIQSRRGRKAKWTRKA